MARRKRLLSREEMKKKEVEEPMAQTPDIEKEEEEKPEPIVEKAIPPKEPAKVEKKEEPVKVVVTPILMLQEFVRGYKNFKPHHLPAIVSFFQSRGFALRGTAEDLTKGLEAFGWSRDLRTKSR